MEKAVLSRLTSLCIVCGMVAVVLMGVAAFRDGKREWKEYQARYKDELLKKLNRDKNPALYDRIAGAKPEVKQVVLEQLGSVERCTTCHLGIDDPLFAGAKEPLRTHPYPELLKSHPVEKFGCTICHGGQGLATTYEGAAHHSLDNWAVPMVTKGLIQSRCGMCHKDYEAIKADRLIAGREAFKEMHCVGCHQVEREGGAVGPDLSAFGDKDPGNFSYLNLPGNHSKQAWVVEHFKDPKKMSPGSPMRTYAMNDEQINALASYVLSLSKRDLPRQYVPKIRPDFVPYKLDVLVPEAPLSASAEDEATFGETLPAD